MDTSETYIKMCEKATEIQELGSSYCDDWSMGVWYSPNHVRCKGHFEDWHMKYKYCPVCSKSLKITPEYSICRYSGEDTNTWLPRQDQLQEIMSDYIQSELGIRHPEIKAAFITFAQWLNEQYHNEPFTCVPTNCFGTGEQLWIAFVMEEKFKKKWNDMDWISATKISKTKTP